MEAYTLFILPPFLIRKMGAKEQPGEHEFSGHQLLQNVCRNIPSPEMCSFFSLPQIIFSMGSLASQKRYLTKRDQVGH